MEKDEIVKYWIKSSDNDYNTMEYLYKGKNYPWSLFVGHIVIEKLYYKLNFYKKCTEKFADKYISQIRNFRIWIKKLL